jgi:hypothetical protein
MSYHINAVMLTGDNAKPPMPEPQTEIPDKNERKIICLITCTGTFDMMLFIQTCC